jgi:hypothetical protein
VATRCTAMANFDYEELFVFEMSAGSPKLLARLSPSEWGKGEQCSGANCPMLGLRIDNRQLAVGFGTGGSRACPDQETTVKFQWNGGQFLRAALDRVPYRCR